MRLFVVILAIIFVFSGCKKDSEKYIAKINGNGVDREKFDKLSVKRITQIEKFGRKITPSQKYTFQKRLLDNLVKTQIFRRPVIPACAGMTKQGTFYNAIITSCI